MKVSDIIETSLIKKSNQLNVNGEKEQTNFIVAKRLANSAKDRAKKGNPIEADTVVQPSAGGHGSSFLFR